MRIRTAPTSGTRSSSDLAAAARRVARDGRRGAADASTAPRASSTSAPASTTCSIPARSRSSARSSAATEAPADAIVMGSGRIDGRPVMVAAEDFTVKAGTISQSANSKRYRVAELAVADRVPLVMMLEGAGLPGRRAAATARDADRHARPGAVLGPGAARHRGARRVGRARRAGRADVGLHGDEPARRRSSPPVRRSCSSRWARRSPRRTSAVPAVALASGLIHNVADDDAAALDLVRTLPALLPVVGVVVPARRARRRRRAAPRPRDPRHRAAQRPARLRHAQGDRRRLRRRLVRSRCSPSSGGRSSARSCRLGGHPVAVDREPAAGDRRLDRRRRRRQGRALHHRRRLVPPAARVPRPTIPACMPGSASEKARHPAQGRAHVRGADAWRPSPKFEVTLRKAYGFGSMVMGMIPFDGQSGVFAFPGATMGAMGAAAMSRSRRLRRRRGGAAAHASRSRRRTDRRRRSASTS